jgi:hypothetical protein
MLRKIAYAGLGLALLVTPSFTFAQSTTSSQVAALLAQIQQLQAQLSQGQTSVGAFSCIDLSYNLYVGSKDSATGGQVTKLQQFLGMSATGYFGSLTQQAVQKWQSSRGVVSSGSPSTTGFGSVGPKTRTAMGCASGTLNTNSTAALNSNPNAQVQTYTNAQYGFSFQYPSDFSAAPASVLNGAKVTVTQLNGSFFPAPQVLIEASADPSAVSTCNTENLSALASLGSAALVSVGANITPTTGTQTIGGVSFRSASVTADLEGSFVQVTLYAALHNGICYAIGTAVEGKDPSTQGQLQSISPIGLPASAASIAAEENTILQSLSFSIPTASAQSSSTNTTNTATQPWIGLLQSTLTQSSNSFSISGSDANVSGLFVAIVGSSYAGPSDYTSITNLMKGSGQYEAVGNTATLESDSQWSAPFNNVANGTYKLYIYATPSNTLLATETLTVNASSVPTITFTYPPSTVGQQFAIGSGLVIQWQTSGPIPSGAFIEFSLAGTNGSSYGIPSDPITPSLGSYAWLIEGPVCVPDPNYPGTQTCSATLNPGQYQLVARMYSTVVNGQPSGLVTQASSPWFTLTGTASNNVDPLKG